MDIRKWGQYYSIITRVNKEINVQNKIETNKIGKIYTLVGKRMWTI